jgi:hypothetical protein
MSKDYGFQAAFPYRNRVCQIDLRHITSLLLQLLASAMQEQFPALIHLRLDSADMFDDPSQDLPGGFLCGDAPRLQSLELNYIAFPALPTFLLSTKDLVRLSLRSHLRLYSEYVTPDAIVTSLALLANLKFLTIEFDFLESRPELEGRCSPPPTRTVLPSLTLFKFRGTSEYLDDLVARIDVPLLDSFFIAFFNEFIFDISQLGRFMRRTTSFQALNEAHVHFDYCSLVVDSHPPTRTLDKRPGLTITCRAIDWELSNLVQVFTSLFPSIYTAEHLYLYGPRTFVSEWQDPMEWLENFRPFTAVKNLYVIKELTRRIAPALQELVGESVTGVLPVLESLSYEGLLPSGPVQEAIGQFVAARQLVDHPVAISCWKNTSNIGIISFTSY